MSATNGKPRRYGLAALTQKMGCASSFAMLQEAVHDGVCPAICVVCGWTTNMEPDQDRGWCEQCDKGGTVKSALILAGMI